MALGALAEFLFAIWIGFAISLQFRFARLLIVPFCCGAEAGGISMFLVAGLGRCICDRFSGPFLCCFHFGAVGRIRRAYCIPITAALLPPPRKPWCGVKRT